MRITDIIIAMVICMYRSCYINIIKLLVMILSENYTNTHLISPLRAFTGVAFTVPVANPLKSSSVKYK